ncbi:beta-1,3-galactosyltransferase 5-like [Rhipicephalus sanguineus]|uniref:beta-1,3-galactosyltransferase 5-like n=1 Tax=Rhipicephalus sanguineus TaxID=34632 RepID=UPI001894AD24|nr:beta-1,3-galactosyltransferase 5-like [Rhipicephalus sanguineus]
MSTLLKMLHYLFDFLVLSRSRSTFGYKHSAIKYNMSPCSAKGMNIGKNFNAAFLLVCSVLFFASLFISNLKTNLQARLDNHKENTSADLFTAEPVPENTSAWKIRYACRRPNLRILYFVHTAPKNVEKRRFLRKTIGDPTIACEMNSAIAFFVGEAPQLNDHEAVLGEALREGDVVVLNFTDTYKNLTYKFVHGAKWVSENCLLDPTATIVKLDDDVLVNTFSLSAYLTSGVMALTGIHCQVITGAEPFRKPISKWYVSQNDYALKVYPPYCLGAVFIMQPSVLFSLHAASSHVPFFWVDDVYITGILAEYANVTLVQMVSYTIIGKGKKTPAVKDTTIFLHTSWYGTSRAEMEQIWQTFKEYNRTVSHNFNRNVHAYYRSLG